MYARSYTADEGTLRIPDGYDGTALIQKSSEPEYESTPHDTSKHEIKISPTEACESEPTFLDNDECDTEQHSGGIKGFFERIFSGVFPIKSFSPKSIFDKIGLEELLIIGVALFLFFSPESDKECAIMLLVLLFIN